MDQTSGLEHIVRSLSTKTDRGLRVVQSHGGVGSPYYKFLTLWRTWYRLEPDPYDDEKIQCKQLNNDVQNNWSGVDHCFVGVVTHISVRGQNPRFHWCGF